MCCAWAGAALAGTPRYGRGGGYYDVWGAFVPTGRVRRLDASTKEGRGGKAQPKERRGEDVTH